MKPAAERGEGPRVAIVVPERGRHSTIDHNFLLDNTDIDLVVGGGPDCTVTNNDIRHFGKYGFAGLNSGNFAETRQTDSQGNVTFRAGDHEGSHFVNNTVGLGFANMLGMGLLVGAHPWNPDVHVYNPSVTNNAVGSAVPGMLGAVINVIVEGVEEGCLSAPCGPDAVATVQGNQASGNTGNRLVGGQCEITLNYSLNPIDSISNGSRIDGGWTPFKYHPGEACRVCTQSGGTWVCSQ